MAQLAKTAYKLPTQEAGESFIDWMDRCEGVVDDLRQASIEAPDDQVQGTVLTFPFADGRAVYFVSKASPLTLQHVPVGDAWQIPAAHIRGITVRDVLEQKRRAKAMAKLFSSFGRR